MAIRKGWKVLSRGRWSAIVRRGSGGVHYPVNRWVKPEKGCGPLAVFTSETWTRSWAGPNCTVHRCEYRHSRLRQLWRFVRGEKRIGTLMPYGTALADAVRTLD
jgi:hypothetical protein